MKGPVKTIFKDAIEKKVPEHATGGCAYLDGDGTKEYVIGVKIGDEPKDLLNFLGK